MSLRVAIVGTGHIGRFHMEAYRAEKDVKIVGVCDSVPERAAQAAAEFGGRPYPAVLEMLLAERIDAVSVCTAGVENGSHHFTPVMECLSAGKHVLCEKPLSNDVTEAREMVKKADAMGVCFGCGLNHRFTPQAQTAKEWLDDGRLGTPLLSNVTLWINNPNDRTPWFHMRALHPHSLDLMRFYCGKAERVHAFFNRSPKADGPDGKRICWSSAQVNVQFANGAIGHLTGSYEANMRLNLERCELLGTGGRFVIDNCYEKLTLYPRNSSELTVIPNDLFWGIPNFDATIGRRVHRWVEQLSAGAAPADIEASGADGLAVQEIIEAAIQSWETSSVVAVQNG